MRKKMSMCLISRKLREDRLKKGKHTEVWKAFRVKYKKEKFLMDLDTWKWDEIYTMEPELVLQKVDMWKKIKQV